MSPFGIENLPADVARALQTVPRISEDTSHLAAVNANTESKARDTASIDKRMQTIEEAMPTLVEVQQHLAALPETIAPMRDSEVTGSHRIESSRPTVADIVSTTFLQSSIE